MVIIPVWLTINGGRFAVVFYRLNAANMAGMIADRQARGGAIA
jgi:hypothetical protein